MKTVNRVKRLFDSIPRTLIIQSLAAGTALAATITLDPWPISQALTHLMLVVAIVMLLMALREKLDDPTGEFRRLWQFLIVAVSMWALGHAYEAGVLILLEETAATPSFADLLRLAGFLAAVAALASVPISTERRFGQLRDILEVSLLLASGLLLFWFVAVEPAIDVGIADLPRTLWASFPPAFELTLVVLSLRLVLLESRRRQRVMLLLIGLGFSLRFPTDLAFGYLLLQEQPLTTTPWIAGWAVAPIFLLAGSLYWDGDAQAPAPREGRLGSRVSERAAVLLPAFLALLIAGFTIVDWLLTQELNWAAVVASLGLGLLLVARQGVVAGQAEMRQYASLVHGAADMAFVCDMKGIFLLSNPSMEESLGWTDAERERRNLFEILDHASPEALLETALHQGWSGEVGFRRSDGGIFPVALALRPVLDERRGEAILAATAHNLTTLKAREAELESALAQVASASEALEKLNQALEEEVEDRTRALKETVSSLEKANEELKELDRLKSEFVALVSHELRGPLSNIRSGVELALSRSESMAEGIESTMNLVASETERLVSFVEIILDLSALEAGRFPLSLEPAPILVICRNVASRFPPDIGGDRIRVEMAEDLPLVLGDERSIMSVLFHLLDNSLKYAPEGPVTVRAQPENGEMCISVVDRGPGIPSEQREEVFERFHRLDSTDSREVYGHGLGLHLARRLVEAMGGSIQVGESEGGGAHVSFRLPLVH
jgi:PAS domain S-box-containing protein